MTQRQKDTKTQRQKDKKTQRQKDTKTKRHKDKKDKITSFLLTLSLSGFLMFSLF